MKKMKKRIWVAWETQRRSIELSRRLGCTLYIIDMKGLLRYPVSILKTIYIFIKDRPTQLFVQNPSMILTAIACILCKKSKTYLIVDRHSTFRLNKPESGTLSIWFFMKLHYFTLKHADLTIVTNYYLAKLVFKSGGKAFILPDPLPYLKQKNRLNLLGKVNILMICSFGQDEPIDEVINAMKIYKDSEIYMYISGNYKKRDPHIQSKCCKNVVFTGFLSDQKFIDLLFSVDLVLALTTSDYCMLCGCYEAIAAKKPLITSDKEVLRDYFSLACFVNNSADSIASCIKKVSKKPEKYKANSVEMKTKIENRWDKKKDLLENVLNK